ncbi:hypothetical protein P3X46_017162 [Hevea brasiliensis]|uniref:Phytocyanin domain-containing protein n=1 Tax=Hevea brasiliensis TaxID=3981 RepID=A0ABQ9M1C7_HEVBR|nr:early nodulin-like protein 6 [Hevea brasiliensis]KAJ9174097.1 hypothetical protein P3X46_017162 [Hevea brasiliensis]
MGSCNWKLFLFLILFCFSFLFSSVISTEFLVGGHNGSWVVPNSKKDDQIYNHWASKNRFKVNDTLHFKYKKKDSVMVVSEEDYKKCRSAHPFFFSNNGETLFILDRPGLFYFMSGVSGHCQKGQKMIIKVKAFKPESPPHNHDDDDDEPRKKNGAVQMAAITSAMILLLSFSSIYSLLN